MALENIVTMSNISSNGNTTILLEKPSFSGEYEYRYYDQEKNKIRFTFFSKGIDPSTIVKPNRSLGSPTIKQKRIEKTVKKNGNKYRNISYKEKKIFQ